MGDGLKGGLEGAVFGGGEGDGALGGGERATIAGPLLELIAWLERDVDGDGLAMGDGLGGGDGAACSGGGSDGAGGFEKAGLELAVTLDGQGEGWLGGVLEGWTGTLWGGLPLVKDKVFFWSGLKGGRLAMGEGLGGWRGDGAAGVAVAVRV